MKEKLNTGYGYTCDYISWVRWQNGVKQEQDRRRKIMRIPYYSAFQETTTQRQSNCISVTRWTISIRSPTRNPMGLFNLFVFIHNHFKTKQNKTKKKTQKNSIELFFYKIPKKRKWKYLHLNKLGFISVKHLKLTVLTSVLW